MSKIERALVSVSDKSGLVDFMQALYGRGVEIVSTGGTARALKKAGIPVIEIDQYTGFPEMLDGRVKTLHPKVHGGLLYIRGNQQHETTVRQHGIQPIDLVVVNLYPFEQTIAQADVALGEAIENIDIGGPSMLRSAAKNHASVTVVVDPADYPAVLKDIEEHDGNTCDMFRWKLAVKVFETTARYDGAIAMYLHGERMKAKDAKAASQRDQPPGTAPTPGWSAISERASAAGAFPALFNLSLTKVQDLRYGENPHQRAALYGDFGSYFKQQHGKELSYNNILDLTAAAELISEFEDPTVAIVKHTNPCGVASAPQLAAAWQMAFATDTQAPFGGIIAVNRRLDGDTAAAIAEIFSEVIVAPDFSAEALDILQKKKNLRLVAQLPNRRQNPVSVAVRSVTGGVLIQDRDTRLVSAADMKLVTQRQPTKDERHALLFAWRVVKHVKSNAIVYAHGAADGTVNRTLGIGAGQMSRIDSARIAVWKAGEAGLDLTGSALASDAFLPFPDSVQTAADAGATCLIQPGGSVRDNEVIRAANERNLAMLFTGIRHFRH